MTTLGECLDRRDNSFLLVRLLAALAVLVSHGVALHSGHAETEPWRQAFGITPGSVAVDVFFVVSGLLITQSLDRRRDAIAFWAARLLRIWPGLLVALVLTTLVGSALTKLPATRYWLAADTWRYLLWNSTVVWRTAYELPGLFTDNPFPRAVNGSLWSLRFEVRAYLGLFVAWWCLQAWGRPGAARALALAAALVLMGLHLQAVAQGPVEASPWRLYALFAVGAALHHWRAVCPFTPAIVTAHALALLLALFHRPWFAFTYSLVLPGLVLGVALLPQGRILKFNRLGDLSFGVYLYAFPVQQCVMQWCPTCSLSASMAETAALTLTLAALSWHWVEKPMVAWGAEWLRRHRAGGQR